MGSIVEPTAALPAPMEEADDALTLQEALAFIDTFEVGAETDTSAPSPSGSSPEPTTNSPPATKADKKRRNSLAVRRCQLRKKQEKLELREQVAALDRQLTQLQRLRRVDKHRQSLVLGGSGGVVELNASAKSSWIRVAQRELVTRQRSEAINKQLRAAVAKHRDLSAAIQAIVGVGALDNRRLASLLDDPPTPPLYSSPKKVFCMDHVLADLEIAMEQLYIDADAVLNPISVDLGADGGDNRVEVKQSAKHGEYIQISRAFVAPLPMETVATGMWSGICTQNMQSEIYHIKVRAARDSDGHKNFELQLDDSARSTRYTLDGISYMKKFEENDRWLFAFTSLITIPGLSGITFRERSWLQLTRSPDGPATRSVFRMCYHVYPVAPALRKPPVLDSPDEAALRHTQTFLLQGISAKICSDSAKIQRVIYNQAACC